MSRTHLLAGLAAVTLAAAGAGPAIGTVTADVALTATDGAPRRLRTLEQAPVTVLVFLSAQCPISNKYVARLNQLGRDFAGRATVVGINSNRNETLEEARQHAADYRLEFPVFKDPGNAAADVFGVAVTPEAVVLDGDHRLRYRGRIDDAQNPARVKRHDLRLAIEAVVGGRRVERPEAPPAGCTIKRVAE